MKTKLSPSEQVAEPQETQKAKLIAANEREKLEVYISGLWSSLYSQGQEDSQKEKVEFNENVKKHFLDGK